MKFAEKRELKKWKLVFHQAYLPIAIKINYFIFVKLNQLAFLSDVFFPMRQTLHHIYNYLFINRTSLVP